MKKDNTVISEDDASRVEVENDTSIFDVINIILKQKKKILYIIAVFFVLGIVSLIITDKKYTSNSLILPQVSSDKGFSKKYTDIASLVGIDFNQSKGNSIVPSLYPLLLDNVNFQKSVLKSKVQEFNSDTLITYKSFLLKNKSKGFFKTIQSYTIGLPSKIKGFFTKPLRHENKIILVENLNNLTIEEISLINSLKNQIDVVFNEVDGYIEIKAETKDPLVSTQLVFICESILQEHIINYKIQKSKDELSYLEERYNIAKEDYSLKRAMLGTFKDENKFVSTSYNNNIKEQLQAEYDLSYKLYSQLATQMESARLQVYKDTPIFTNIKPAIVPIEPSSPDSFRIIFGFLLVGFLFAIFNILYVAFKNNEINFKSILK